MSPGMIEFFNVVFRFVHIVAAIMWIGDSLLFVWMEINLIKDKDKDKSDSLGHMNMLHGGGVFFLEKRVLHPDTIPNPLHRFKWQAYTTWLSGFTLLVTTFYTRSGTLLLDPSKTDMLGWQASLISFGSLVIGWVIYDQIWKSPLKHKPGLAAGILFGLFIAYANWIDGFFNGRFLYLQLGAMLGTTMAANVFFRIMPGQRQIMKNLMEGKPHDLEIGRQAKLRSMMNHYVTFPVIFLMLSAHFPVLYGDDHRLILMTIVVVCLAIIKWMMNLYKVFAEWLHVAIATFVLGVFAVATVIHLPDWGEGAAAGPALSDSATNGKQLFSSKGCAACHQPVDSSIAPTLHGLYGRDRALSSGGDVLADEAYLDESIRNSRAKIAAGFAPSMPVFGDLLSDDEVADLIEYIKTLE